MASFYPSSNRQPDNGRSFISSILSKLPYVQDTIELDNVNSKYELFDRLSKRRDLRLMQQSVITGPDLNQSTDYSNPNSFVSENAYHKYIYAKIDVDKTRRIAEYRRMAAYAEVGDCLDEICDEFINKDENGRVIKINFSSFSKLEGKQRSELEKEFYKFINIYDLESKGWSYCRQLLVGGELFFENIVHNEKKDLGVIGVLEIPTELINPIYDNVQNSVIQNFVFQKPISLTDNKNEKTPQRINNTSPSNALQQQIITFQGNQVTYINSGIWNEDMTIRIPFIENCRRAYKQLSLIEDSIVIYRLVRAPERLKFKIDVGNMPPAKAEAYVRQLMQSYWNKKTYDGSGTMGQKGAANTYDPQSMLDSFWFTKRAGEQGSDVEMLQGGQNLGELKDLMYFVNKLYKSLKVPLTRLNPEDSYKDGAEILREELRFAKFIVRLQMQFAEGLKNAFITHLKIRNWWKEYKLHESYFDLEFNVPSNFFAIRKNQEFELKFKLFSDLTQNESISKTFAQRHYLGYNDSRISENMEWLRKDAALKWEIDQIAQTGPNWREHIEAAENAAKETEAGGSMGGGGGISTSEIPEFGSTGGAGGGGGAVGGEAAPTETPEAGGETPTPESGTTEAPVAS